MYSYNLSFAGQQFNYASAIAIIMGIVTMMIAYAVPSDRYATGEPLMSGADESQDYSASRTPSTQR